MRPDTAHSLPDCNRSPPPTLQTLLVLKLILWVGDPPFPLPPPSTKAPAVSPLAPFLTLNLPQKA